MKIIFEYDVNSCEDCPFKHLHRGHGEYWNECKNENSGRLGYYNILQDGVTPEWCPIGLGSEHG